MKRNLIQPGASPALKVLVLIVACTLCKMAFAKDETIKFTTLPEAVSFITACLDSGDSAKLHAACLKGKRSEKVFPALLYIHKKSPLPALYTGREFPSEGTTFKLGGHNRELGHIHIDFIKQGKSWCINSIWICR